jgi:hypothetical protein
MALSKNLYTAKMDINQNNLQKLKKVLHVELQQNFINGILYTWGVNLRPRTSLRLTSYNTRRKFNGKSHRHKVSIVWFLA